MSLAPLPFPAPARCGRRPRRLRSGRQIAPQIGEAVPMATAAVFGARDVGSAVLRRLAACDEIERLCAFDLDEERARCALVDAAAIASYTKRPPVTEWALVEMRDPDRVAAALER